MHCTPAKSKLLRLLGLPPEWLALLTGVPEEAQVGGAWCWGVDGWNGVEWGGVGMVVWSGLQQRSTKWC